MNFAVEVSKTSLFEQYNEQDKQLIPRLINITKMDF